MTKIEVHYINGEYIYYRVKDPVVGDQMYYETNTSVEFKAVDAHTLKPSTVIIPLNNVMSIKIWEEGDEVDEGKN